MSSTQVNTGPLKSTWRPNKIVGPEGIEVLTTETLLADLTAAQTADGVLWIMNNGPDAIYWCLHDSASVAPGVSTANGIELGPDALVAIDQPGGLAVWAITTVDQVSPADTRVSGAYR